MYDNAPIHPAGITEAFLAQNRIVTMSWPANSPDLNPIEHLWHHMKVKFHTEFFSARQIVPSHSQEALAVLELVWNTQLGDLPQRLVASMPGRVAAARCGHTHY
jgi:transposase